MLIGDCGRMRCRLKQQPVALGSDRGGGFQGTVERLQMQQQMAQRQATACRFRHGVARHIQVRWVCDNLQG